ncbi:hypothetical protein ACTFIZ_002305 [Dictyostelium cf. discoideum]
MENIINLKTTIQRGDYMVKIDIKDAFLHVSLDPDHYKFFGFIWRGINYVFKSLPFGYKLSPWVFTQVLKVVARYLRIHGIRCIFYLDDILIISSSRSQSVQDVKFVVNLFIRLGFIINQRKSILIPTQEIEFLGFVINSVDMTLNVSPSRLLKIKNTAISLSNRPQKYSLRLIASLIGQIRSINLTTGAVNHKLYHLQTLLTTSLRKFNKNWDTTVLINEESFQEISWWLLELKTNMRGASIIPVLPSLKIITDASKTGWGAHLESDGSWRQGVWSRTQSKECSSNWKELMAISLSIQFFCELFPKKPIDPVTAKVIQISTDNTTAIIPILETKESIDSSNSYCREDELFRRQYLKIKQVRLRNNRSDEESDSDGSNNLGSIRLKKKPRIQRIHYDRTGLVFNELERTNECPHSSSNPTHSTMYSEDKIRWTNFSNDNSPSLDFSTVVSVTNTARSYSQTNNIRSSSIQERGSRSIFQELEMDRHSCIRQELINQGYEFDIAKEISLVGTPSSIKANNSFWKQWYFWCIENSHDPLRFIIHKFISFLHSKSNKCKYATLRNMWYSILGTFKAMNK